MKGNVGIGAGFQRGLKSRTIAWYRAEDNRRKTEIIAGIVAGLFIGAIMLLARRLPSNWAGLVILATVAPTIALLVNNMKSLLLVVLIVDIPLGLDIALFNQEDFNGGPPGLIISLMTIALLVGYAIWIVKKPTDGRSKVSSHFDVTLPIAVYFIFIVVSALFAIELQFSLYSIFLHLQFVLMYLYLINHVENWADVRLIFTVLVISVLFESLLIMAQNYLGFGFSVFGITSGAWTSDIASANVRAAGTLGPPNTAATYLATFLAVIFAGTLAGNKLINWKLSLIGLLVGIVALVATQSRMAWFAFAVALIIITAGAAWKRIGAKAIWLLLIIGALIGAGFSNQILERFTSTGRISALSRIWYNELALNVINDHMYTGVGANNQRFIIDDNDYVPMELLGRNRTLIHNKYLSTWVEIGVFGFLAFIWLLLAAGRKAVHFFINTKNSEAAITLLGVLAALVAYSMHMLVATFTGRARLQILWLLLALIVAISKIIKQDEEQNNLIHESKKSE